MSQWIKDTTGWKQTAGNVDTSALNAKQDKLTAGTNITISSDNVISASGGSGGTSDYSALSNKPKINNVELSGNKTLESLGIASASDLSSLSNIVGTVNTMLEEV